MGQTILLIWLIVHVIATVVFFVGIYLNDESLLKAESILMILITLALVMTPIIGLIFWCIGMKTFKKDEIIPERLDKMKNLVHFVPLLLLFGLYFI